MKRITLSALLLTFTSFSYATNQFNAEVLISKSNHKIETSATESLNLDTDYSTNSLGLRFTALINNNVGFELSAHDHGEGDANIWHATPLYEGPDDITTHYEFYRVTYPTKLASYRVGVKGQIDVFESVYLYGRVGIANWRYKSLSPHDFYETYDYRKGASGYDVYYGLGASYALNENLTVGIEISRLSIDDSKHSNPSELGIMLNEGDKYKTSFQHDLNEVSLVLGWQF